MTENEITQIELLESRNQCLMEDRYACLLKAIESLENYAIGSLHPDSYEEWLEICQELKDRHSEQLTSNLPNRSEVSNSSITK